MKNNLKNKVVLITGSSIGIGRETAFKFAAEGCKVVITYYADRDEALKAARVCRYFGASDILVLKLNVLDNASIRNAIGEVVEKFGGINFLVNNAGIIVWKSLWEQSFENIEQQLRVNLEGLIKITKESLPYIKDGIINVASGAGVEANENLTAYSTSKFGVRGFTQALAQELTNLKIYSVNPGLTATRMTDYKGQPADEVASIIANAAKGIYDLKSGSDINVWEYQMQPSK